MEHAITKDATSIAVAMAGDLTFADHEKFRTILVTLSASPECPTVVFDLNNITFIDSAGIGMLIIANDECKDRRQKLTIRGAKDQVKAALDIADIKSLITLTE